MRGFSDVSTKPVSICLTKVGIRYRVSIEDSDSDTPALQPCISQEEAVVAASVSILYEPWVLFGFNEFGD